MPTKNSVKIGADVGRQSADVARFSKILLADHRPTVGLGNVTVVLCPSKFIYHILSQYLKRQEKKSGKPKCDGQIDGQQAKRRPRQAGRGLLNAPAFSISPCMS